MRRAAPRLAVMAAVAWLAPPAVAWLAPPALAQPAPPPLRAPAGGRVIVDAPTFSWLEDDGTRVSVAVPAAVQVTETRSDAAVVYRFHHAQLAPGAGRVVETTFLATAAVSATLFQEGGDVDLVIALRQPAQPSSRVVGGPWGSVLQVDFPRIDEPPPLAPPPPPRPRRAPPAMSRDEHPDTPSAAEIPPDKLPGTEPPAPAAPPPEKPANRPNRDRDHRRFRGAVALEGGALIVPGVVAPAAVGLQAQLGVQLDHEWAVVPTLDLVAGPLGGVNLGAALLVEGTWEDTLSFGLGPDLGFFLFGGAQAASLGIGGGRLYGGRVHFAWYPVLGWGEDGVRRKALSLGADLRLLGGAAAFGTSSTGAISKFAVAPMLSLGYQAF
jgi:hypothetical protein